MTETTLTYADCLDNNGCGKGDCDGAVEHRFALSSTGRSFARCDYHWDKRVERQEQINSRYGGDVAPSDFDPTYAGERWDDGY